MAQPETDDLMNVDADALRALVRREREMNQRLQNEARHCNTEEASANTLSIANRKTGEGHPGQTETR